MLAHGLGLHCQAGYGPPLGSGTHEPRFVEPASQVTEELPVTARRFYLNSRSRRKRE
jgi:hypothetical protein